MKRRGKAASAPLARLERVRRRLRQTLCSEPWVEVVLAGGAYAPDVPCGCRRCRGLRKWPRGYVGSSGMSYECVLESMPQEAIRALPGTGSRIEASRVRGVGRIG